jgi:hypothetical protein
VKEELLRLLKTAIKNKDYMLSRQLIEGIVAMENGSPYVYYVPEFSNPMCTEDYDTYEYMYKNIIN